MLGRVEGHIEVNGMKRVGCKGDLRQRLEQVVAGRGGVCVCVCVGFSVRGSIGCMW